MNDIIAVDPSPVAGSPAVINDEIASIETLMRTNRTAYNRDTAKQTRLRQLYSAREGQSTPTILSDQPVFEIISRAEFEREHGSSDDYGIYLQAARAASDILMSIPTHELAQFNASFEALPDSVTDAALAEILAKAPPRAPIDNRDIERFGTKNWGAVLLREWGQDAHARLGTLRSRMERLILRMDESSADRLFRWLDGLSDLSAIAVFRKLAG